jgi:hypothetical protein
MSALTFGRPTTFDPIKAAAILELVAGEASSLRKACESFDLPESTFRTWCDSNDELYAQYVRAREYRAHRWADEIVEIPDSIDLDGEPMAVRNRLEHAKQRREARTWSVARILAKLYGDKLDVNHAGTVGLQLVNDIPRPQRVIEGEK